jgi:hypothetical protein
MRLQNKRAIFKNAEKEKLFIDRLLESLDAPQSIPL